VFVSEAFSTTREDPTLRRERGPLYAFTMQGLYATGVPLWIWHRARDAVRVHRAGVPQVAAGPARLADNAVVQADVARARRGSARLAPI
jgi:hypothetical protein